MAAKNNTGGVNRARQISKRSIPASTVQQVSNIVNSGLSKNTPADPPVPTTSHPFYPDPGSFNWGPAAQLNAGNLTATRNPLNAFKGDITTIPILFAMAIGSMPPRGVRVPGHIPTPNPAYLQAIPPKPVAPTPESPITKSMISTIVDKIVKESEEVVRETEVKQEPVREQVDVIQDIVRPPAAITPTELVLENQAACQQDVVIPKINIVNEFNPVIDLSVNASASGSATATATVELRLGCTDPDALNYDPAATLENGSCLYEPVGEGEVVVVNEPPPPPPLDMPDTVTFFDSHGAPLFDVLKAEVTKTEQSDTDGFATLPNGTQVLADLELVDTVTRPASQESDIIISEEPIEVTTKKTIRDIVGGELAEDTKLLSDQDIVIYGNRESLKKNLVRNDSGIIILSTSDDVKLKVSLRCQSFAYRKYKTHINTEISELLGKL